MARYIDADELLNNLPDDLPYKASVKRVLIQAPTEDVVPKSEDMVSIRMLKKWLYSIAINNVGCVLDGDFSDACEEIISRLDGLKRYVKDMESEDKG